jgi:hypothetical protein
VDLGGWDWTALRWLTDQDVPTVAAVAGWVSRACPPCIVFTAGQETVVARALADAEAYRRERVEAYCYDCQRHTAGACEDHLNDLDQADAYRDLAAELARVLPRGEHGAARNQAVRTLPEPPEACQDHLDDLDRADAHRDLAAELATALPQPPEEDR